MIRSAFLLLCVCWLVGCTTPHSVQQASPRTTSPDFLDTIDYPYQAPELRRLQIERAVRELPMGATEAQVLALLGPPDYKASIVGPDKRIGPWSAYAEVWHYVHSLDHRPAPGDEGKILVITLSNKTDPRIVTGLFPHGIGKRSLPRHGRT